MRGDIPWRNTDKGPWISESDWSKSTPEDAIGLQGLVIVRTTQFRALACLKHEAVWQRLNLDLRRQTRAKQFLSA